ncbi:MAG: hypothetical protein EAZ91_08410 [Cytophagales bacterium]|nr:MAG: hypothetical protein EAZ91_08410 [Cytophagales bacterium]
MQNNFTFLRVQRGLLPWLFSLLCVTSVFGQTCPVPTNFLDARNATSTSVELSFGGGELGASYEIQYKPTSSTAPFASLTFVTPAGTGGKFYTLTNLTPNTIYQWRVRTLCSNGSVSAFYNPANNFQTACAAPTNFLDARNVTSTSAELSFGGGELGASYEIQYKPTSSTAPFTSLTFVTSAGTGGKFYTLTDLIPNTIYQWRVRTVCAPGIVSSFYIPANNFQTTCAAPTAFLEARNITSTSAELSFGGGESSASYEIQYKPTSSTASFTSLTFVTAAGTGAKFYTITNLLPNTVYQWRVRTVCAPGITSGFYIPANNFQTLCRVPSSPFVDQITNNSARVSWQDGEVGADYEVQYRIRNTNAAWTSATLVTPLGISARKHFTIIDIKPGTIYEWRVRSICAPGITSDFMIDPNSFQTLCGTPNQLTTDQLTSTSARLNWFGGEAGASYEINIRVSGTTSWSTVPVSTTQGPGEFKRRIVTGLTGGTVYEWRVRTVCTAGIYSDYALPPVLFTTVCNPPVPQGVQNLLGASVEVVWNGGESGAGYEVQYRGVNTIAWTTASMSSSLGAADSKRLVLTGLAPGVIYEWQVRTVCSSGVPSSYTLATARFQVPVQNVFMGVGAGQSISTGVGNVGIGTNASFSITTADNTVALGKAAGLGNTSSGNTFVGAEADALAPNLSNATAIGLRAKVGASNAIVLGDVDANTKVGIGVTAPEFPLDVRGIINLRNRGTLKFSHLLNPNLRPDGTDQFLTVDDKGQVVLSRYRVSIANPNQWADRVFEPGYRLRPLSEVQRFIGQHNHLPGIPSAEQVTREGIEATKLNALLLEKIEELTLYLIQIRTEVDALKRK